MRGHTQAPPLKESAKGAAMINTNKTEENIEFSTKERDRALWIRLFEDARLTPLFHGNEYLKKRLTPTGWALLFDCIWQTTIKDFEGARDKFARHKEKLNQLEEHLSKAAGLMNEIEDLSAIDSLPDVFYCPFDLIDRTAKPSQDGRPSSELECLYEWHIAPLLLPMQGFDARYYPSVTMLLETLSDQIGQHAYRIDERGPNVTYSHDVIALTTRQYAPLPFFVRQVDRMMQSAGYVRHVGGQDFLIPSEAMAAVAGVASHIRAEYYGKKDKIETYEARQINQIRNATFNSN